MKLLPSLLAVAALIAPLALLASPPERTTDERLTLRVAPEREYVYRHGPREVIVEVEVQARHAENGRRTPVNVSVVLDRSGSMEGAKLEKARQAACVALDRLDAEDTFSMVVYDNHAELLIPPRTVGSRDDREEMKERIHRIRPGGGTALYAGVKLGGKYVTQLYSKDRVNRVILLSDGIANVGPCRTSDLVELGRQLRGEGVSVSTIGLGEDFNEDLMTALAEASHANYYYVRDAEKLPGIFAEELGAAGALTAANIRIRVEVSAGVRVREVLGHPEVVCHERTAEIVLPELFGSEHRLFHLRCVLDEATAETQSLGEFSLNYENPEGVAARAQNQAASVHLTDDAERSEHSVQDAVARNIAVVQNRLDKETAVRLADSGKAPEAAKVLRERIAANTNLPAAQQLPDVRAENAKLGVLADELSRTGNLQNTSRKSAQWDNYQDKYQKK